jgi:hypothetical protein
MTSTEKSRNIEESPKKKLSEEEAIDKHADISKRIRSLHEELNSIGTSTGTLLQVETLRSPAVELDISVADINKFLEKMGALEIEVESFNWSFNKKPQVTARLVGFNIFSNEKHGESVALSCDVHIDHLSLKNVSSLNLIGLNRKVKFESYRTFEDKFDFNLGDKISAEIDLSNVNFNEPFGVNCSYTYTKKNIRLIAKGAVFKEKIELNRIRNITIADFSNCKFEGSANFLGCSFDCSAKFENAFFEKDVLFKQCNFHHAPNMHDAKLPQQTRFSVCTFMAAGEIFKSICIQSDIASYRVLRGHFSRLRDARQEAYFYALEQRGERYLADSEPVETLLSWIYDLVSSYGQSSSRAICWFILWNIFFACLFQLLFSTYITPTNSAFQSVQGIALALQNTFNPIALISEKPFVKITNVWVYAIALIQSMGSIGIITLFLLAVRGRFKKGSSSEN